MKFWHVAEIDASKSIPLQVFVQPFSSIIYIYIYIIIIISVFFYILRYQGRSAILAEQRNNTFLDVCCAPNNQTFAITETSLLVEFHDKKVRRTYIHF